MQSWFVGVAVLFTPVILLGTTAFVLRRQTHAGLFAWALQAAIQLALLHLFSARMMSWQLIGESYRLVFAVIALVLVGLCFRYQSKGAWFPLGCCWTNAAHALLFAGVMLVNCWLGSTGDAQVDLKNPINGSQYFVVQGGGNRLTNHHYSDSVQRYAADLVVGRSRYAE